MFGEPLPVIMKMDDLRWQVGLGLPSVKAENLVAPTHQPADDGGTDKPRPADHQNPHGS
jgi:hypothetical protein